MTGPVAGVNDDYVVVLARVRAGDTEGAAAAMGAPLRQLRAEYERVERS